MKNILLAYLNGLLLLIYGVVKITLAILSFSLSEKAKRSVATIPIVGWILNTDNTISGRLIDVVLAVFGVFTIIHSLHLFRLKGLPSWIHFLAESEEFNYNVHLLIGTVLFFFYILVAYMDIGIPKSDDATLTYKIGGVAGGLAFWIAVPIMYLYYTYSNKDVRRSLYRLFTIHRIKATLAVLSFVVLLIGIIAVIAEALVDNTPPNKGGNPHIFSVFVASQLSYL